MSEDETPEAFERQRLRRVDYCRGRSEGYYEGRLDGYPIGVLATMAAVLLQRIELLLIGLTIMGAIYVRLLLTRPR